MTALDKKKEVVNIVLSRKESISSIAKKYDISRDTIYRWVKEGVNADNYLRGDNHPNALYPKAKKEVIRLITKDPSFGCRKLSQELLNKNIKLSHSQVNKLLNKLGAENYDRRINFSNNYQGPGRFKDDVRSEIINKYLDGEKISTLALKYNISRDTIYRWINNHNLGLGLSDKYVKGKDHPNAIYPTIEPKVLQIVGNNPNLSAHLIAKEVNCSVWTIWKILEKNNLNHVSQRIIYAENLASREQKAIETKSSDTVRSVFDTFVPNVAPVPPPSKKFDFKLLRFFILFPIFIFLITYASMYWISAITSIGAIFANAALVMGMFFFLYSLKYYISLAIVLSHLQDDGIVKKGKNLIDWVLGNNSDIVNNNSKSIGLEPDIDNIILKDHPFVSVHIALFNERNVVERLVKAVTSFEYDNYEVILADDSTDETTEKIRKYQEKYLFKGEQFKETKGDGWTLTSVEVRKGVTFKHLHRLNRSGYKGGALDLALKLSDPKTEFVSIFDADFVPYPDSISLFLKYFQAQNDPNVAAVQGYQWHVLNKSENWITRGVRSEYSGSYVIERAGTEIYGGLKQISGSVYMIKKQILEKIGWGTSITEDFELTLKLYEKGFKVVYTPYIQAPAECVSTLKRLIRQRMRWAEGHSFNIKKMFLKLMISKKLSFAEKFETAYLTPYYLQAFFFLVGTLSWLISETVFKVRLPFWTELWGWSLVLTNMISLPLLNSVGLFLEESEQKDYSGIASFVALSYVVVPFQAYASIKGFLESQEGPWFRTPKTGKITDIFSRNKFYRFIQGILPGNVRASTLEESYLALTTANNRFESFNIKKAKNRRWVGKLALVILLVITTNLISLMPYIEVIKGSDISLPAAGKIISFEGLISEVSAAENTFEEVSTGNAIKLLNEKNTYTTSENPKFEIVDTRKVFKKTIDFLTRKTFDEKVKVRLTNSRGEEVKDGVKLEMIGNTFKVKVNNLSDLKLGNYIIEVTYDNEKITQDFNWGVLAINTNKSIYSPNETAKISMAVLNDLGEMVCDAKITLVITNPKGELNSISTDSNGIKVNKDICQSKKFTLDADYQSEFITGQTGVYNLRLEAIVNGKSRVITDSFEVQENPSFDIERVSATRIYPENIYPMIFIVKPNKDFSGMVEEKIPTDFMVTEPKNGELEKMLSFENNSIPDSGAITPFEIKENQAINMLQWVVNWEAGETYFLSYLFDAPNRSPEFYNLGKFNIGGEFYETRTWQIASDAVSTNNPSSNTGGWTNGSNAYGDGTNYANITSGSPSASHTYGNYGFSLTGNSISQVRVRYDASSVGGASASQTKVSTSDGDISGTWQMAQTRISTGTGVSVGTWTASAGNLYDVVAETIWTGNDDADYMNGTTDSGNNYQLFTYSAFSVPASATVNSVTVYERTSDVSTAGNNNVLGALRVNGTVYNAGSRNPPASGSQTWSATATWTQNPNTTSAWTVADVNGTGAAPLQQFGVFSTDMVPDIKVYSVFVVVNYTYASNNYPVIDETIADDTDMLVGTTAAGGYQLFNFSAFTIPTGSAITDLTITYRAADYASTAGTNAARASIKVNGTLYGTTDTGADPAITFADRSYAFTVNPNTTTSWTAADINGTSASPLQQFGVNSTDYSPNVTFSMIYATVNYTTANNEQIAVQVSWDGGTSWSSKQTTDLTSSESTTWYDVTLATTWNATKLNDTNFKVRVEAVTVDETGDVRLDWLPVEVTYTAFLVTGSVYSSSGGAETVCDADGGTYELSLRSASTTVTASCTDTTGAFSFTGIDPPAAGGIFVIWIEALATDGSVVVRYDGGGDSTNNALYESTVSVTSDDTNPVTILNMDAYDNGNDSDIPYTATDAATDTLVVSSNFNFRVNLKSGVANGSTVFDPNGTVTTQGTGKLQIDDNATAYLDTATNTIADDVVVDDGAKINFDADTTINGGDITVTTGGDVSSSAGTVTMGAGGTIGGGGVGSIFQLTNLTISSGTTTLGSDADNSLDFTGDISVSAGAIFAMNGKTANVDGGNLTTTTTGSVTCSGCTSGGLTLAGDGSTNGIGGGSGAITFYNLTLDGSSNSTNIGSSSTSVTVMNDLIIGANRTLVASSGTLSIAHDFTNSGTFTHSSGTVSLTGSADTTQTLTGATTFYNLSATTGDRIIKFASSTTFVIEASGTFTATGNSCDALVVIRATTAGTAASITKTGSVSFSYIDIQDITLSAAGSASNSVDSGNNSNITIAANTCEGASTAATGVATAYSFQRKTLYDSINSRYWLFFYDGSQIEVRYSSDGSTWNVDATHLGYNTNDFSVWWEQIGTTEYVWLAVSSNDDIIVRRGELSTTAITWNASEVVALNGTGVSNTYLYPYISKDSSNYLWVLARYYNGTNYAIKTVDSTTQHTEGVTWSTFAWTTTPYQISDGQTNPNVYGNIVPLSSGNMYATFVSNTALEGCKWVDASTMWKDSAGVTCSVIPPNSAGIPVNINDSSNFGNIVNSERQIVKTSGGNLYAVVTLPGTPAYTEVWKSTDNGASWTEKDSDNHPINDPVYMYNSLAIDSSDNLHIVYNGPGTTGAAVKYIKFTTSTDTYGSEEEAITCTTNLECVGAYISLDTYDVPHVTTLEFDDGNSWWSIYYNNRYGGDWGFARRVAIEVSLGSIGGVSITINDSDIPEISYASSNGLTAAVGNANNATSFTLKVVDATIGGETSIGVVSSTGDTWIVYGDSGETISLAKHTGSTWSTNWSTITSKTDVGYQPSMVILPGTSDIYILYQDDSTDSKVVFDYYNSGAGSPAWAGETTLEIPGTGVDFQNLKTGWSYLDNNFGTASIDYLYSNGTDVFYNQLIFAGSAGTQDAIDTIPTGVSKNFSIVSDGTNVHLVFADDAATDQISYKKWNGTSWSSAVLVTGAADNNDSHVSLSLDTSNSRLYVVWIDTSNSNIFYSFCDTSTGCDADTEWAAESGQETTWVSTGTNTNINLNYSSPAQVFGEWTIGGTSPFTIGSGLVVPEGLWMFMGILPILSYMKKRKDKDKIKYAIR